MPRIQIETLPVNEDVTKEEARRVNGAGDVTPTDQVSLNFGKIEFADTGDTSRSTPKLMQYCASGVHV